MTLVSMFLLYFYPKKGFVWTWTLT